jgi:hypothetical protein
MDHGLQGTRPTGGVFDFDPVSRPRPQNHFQALIELCKDETGIFGDVANDMLESLVEVDTEAVLAERSSYAAGVKRPQPTATKHPIPLLEHCRHNPTVGRELPAVPKPTQKNVMIRRGNGPDLGGDWG